MNNDQYLIEHEERKRNAQISPVERWRLIQQAIAWVDAQQPVSHGHPSMRKAHEREMLAALESSKLKGASNRPG